MLRQSRAATVLRGTKKGRKGRFFFNVWMRERWQSQIHELLSGHDLMNKSAYDPQSTRAPTAQGNQLECR